MIYDFLINHIPMIFSKKSHFTRIEKMFRSASHPRVPETYEKSFASDPKSKYWNYDMNKPSSPRMIFLKTSKKFWFNCPDCRHDFRSSPVLVTRFRGIGCPYCAHRRLCPKFRNCQKCYQNSLAPHSRSKEWDYDLNGDVHPEEVFPNAIKRYWFKCPNLNCLHSYKTSPGWFVNENSACPYCCAATRKMCPAEKNCTICYEKSLANYPLSEFWDYEKNSMFPCEVPMRSGKKFWFKSPVTGNSVEISPSIYRDEDNCIIF